MIKYILLGSTFLVILFVMLHYFLVLVPENRLNAQRSDEAYKRAEAGKCLAAADSKFTANMTDSCQYRDGQCFVLHETRKMYENELTNDRITCQKLWGL